MKPVIDLIQSPWNTEGKVFAGVTLRGAREGEGGYAGFNFAEHVGDSYARVAKHRALLAAQINEDLVAYPISDVDSEGKIAPQTLSWHWLNQVHGTAVHEVVSPAQALIRPAVEADAMLTSLPRQVCCIMTADCLPVFFYNPQISQIAIAHAGWRGLADGILENTLSAMGGDASDINVWFGPAIGPCHFEVGYEVRERFSSATDSLDEQEAVHAAFKPAAENDKFFADIYALAETRLRKMGVKSIAGNKLCTACEPERFFSFRREARSGRLLSLIFIK